MQDGAIRTLQPELQQPLMSHSRERHDLVTVHLPSGKRGDNVLCGLRGRGHKIAADVPDTCAINASTSRPTLDSRSTGMVHEAPARSSPMSSCGSSLNEAAVGVGWRSTAGSKPAPVTPPAAASNCSIRDCHPRARASSAGDVTR
jgi:hypothetical protein